MGGIYYRPFSISNLYKIHKIILYHYGKVILLSKRNNRGRSTCAKMNFTMPCLQEQNADKTAPGHGACGKWKW